jgi:hypothetical protein
VEIANRAGYASDLSLSWNRTRTINIGLNYAAQEEKNTKTVETLTHGELY